jgi:hypothetical protein
MLKVLLTLLNILNLSFCELKFVIEVFRHGAREPIFAPDLNAGELTPSGQRQHYLLGAQLREEYITQRQFLSPHFNQTEFNVISTPFNRTMQSAISQLYGFYPLGSGERLYQNLSKIAVPQFKNLTVDIDSLGESALPGKFQPIPMRLDLNRFLDVNTGDDRNTVE